MDTLEERIRREMAAVPEGPVLVLGMVWPGDVPRVESIPDVDGPGTLPANRRFVLAVVVGVLERLPAEDGAALLAALRDLEARRLLVAVPAPAGPARAGGRWDRTEMLAHGLDAVGEARHGDRVLSLYGFDIDHYKRTPDWLNPRHWANPELWGKFRW